LTGYVCEEHNNPPDFFLDVINGDAEPVQHNAGILRQVYDVRAHVVLP